MMGGLGAHEYMAPCAAGEDRVALGPGYAANVEVALASPEVEQVGDSYVRNGEPLTIEPAIEVGNIFKLGTRYSEPLGATVVDADGKDQALIMGSYGIGPARVMAAAVEQLYGESGMVWPRAIAPYDAHVVALAGADEIAEQAAQALLEAGLDVLLDDRDMRAGEKFADADLVGAPIRVTAGKKSLEDGKVDVRDRTSGEEQRLDVAELGKEV